MSTLGKLFVAIGADTSAFKQELAMAVKEMDKTTRAFNKVGQRFTAVGKGFTAAFTVPILAGGAALGALAMDAANVQQQMNEVFTLLPGITKDAMNEMNDEVKNFAKEFGTLPEETIPALYQAISAGVPKDNVFDFLEIANKAAIGGVTTLETAVDGITSVINAYGKDVLGAGKASDLMFTAVRLGKTTFEELSDSLFNVVPITSSLGVEFGDVTAAIAAMTAQGTPTSVATTQLRQLFVELSKASSKTSQIFQEIAGKSFKQFIAEGGNTQQALQLLEQYAKKTGVQINDLFGSVEAGNAALALTGKGTEAFRQALVEMGYSAGATDEAFAKMEESVTRQLEKLKAQFRILGLEIGEKLLPIIQNTLLPIIRDNLVPIFVSFAEKIAVLAKWFGDLDPVWQKVILAAVAFLAVLGPMLIIVGQLITAWGVISAAVGLAGVSFGALLAPIAAVAAGIIGVIAVGKLLYDNLEAITKAAQAAWGWLQKVFGGGSSSVNVPSYTFTQSMPQLATGTNYVPQDMVAMLHKGEAVVPARFNPAIAGSGVNINGPIYVTANNFDEMVSSIKRRTGRLP